MSILEKFIAGAASGGAEALLLKWKSDILAERDATLARYQKEEQERGQTFTGAENEKSRALTKEEGAADRTLTKEEGAADRTQRVTLQKEGYKHAEAMTDKQIGADDARAEREVPLNEARTENIQSETKINERLLDTGRKPGEGDKIIKLQDEFGKESSYIFDPETKSLIPVPVGQAQPATPASTGGDRLAALREVAKKNWPDVDIEGDKEFDRIAGIGGKQGEQLLLEYMQKRAAGSPPGRPAASGLIDRAR